MGFNDFININPGSSSAEDRFKEVDDELKKDLAEKIQTKLRNKVDPGIDLDSAKKAQKIRARAEDGTIIIDSEDQGAVLSGGAPQREDSSKGGQIEDLFKAGTGVPSFEKRGDGGVDLVYRSVDADQLFGQRTHEEQEAMVTETIKNVLESSVVEAFEKAVSSIESQHPEDKMK